MEPFVGEVRWFVFNFAPRGWAACNGATMQIQIEQNQPLFTLIETTFGGNGTTTYVLPTIASENGLYPCIALEGVFPQRD